ncbi:protocadherin Fat 1 [Caerostris extrusa]|uniref:Protocadherin Fat 1 n=1 Tax=Caerostris extrusa TaxID=172846 RepID=A0AAV4XAQ4_CAEEX|nr:protocadherin Fat 1 [Caerostris extrusa]
MRIPFKPLSERMLQEPFWLGLITVFSVLVIILFVYCIKRKFADKIEKFLAAEIERSKYQPSPPATRYSLSSTQATPGSQSPQTCPKSLLQRIRKNSLLSNNCSPSPTPDRDTSRTFSFDDILRRVHSSKRNKASSSSPSAGWKIKMLNLFHSNTGANQAELSKRRDSQKRGGKIPHFSFLGDSVKESASRRMSLDEFFRMSERKLQIATRRTNSTDTEGREQETSFISMPSPKTLRQSFTDIQSIREHSFEYISSSDSLSGEPYTSEVQADVSPTPPAHLINPGDEADKSPESNASHSATTSPTPSQRAHPISISITVDKCDSDNKPDSEPEDKNCDSETKNSDCGQFTALSSIVSQNSSYLEVPKTIPAIQVISAESEDPHSANESPNFMKDISENSSPYRKDFTQQRKYSVDLPMPKILITTNMNSCDSDEASPPRTPNPNKSMMYLSPLAVISSSTDRTISESNLSTSGYSSISSPGLSRCNSSSPISDDVEHHHHSNCTHKPELHSPKKNLMNSPTISTVWSPGKHRLLCKRNSYQTTSTDDSIDDEGIGMDTGELKAQKVELRGTFDVDMHRTSEQISKQLISSPLLLEPCKPDLLACSVNNKTGNGGNFKGSPRIGMRKSDKNKKFGDKHRRSPVLSPAGTPIKDLQESPENRIPRNSSRTSMSGPLVSSSESEDSECYMGARQKSRRSKKHDAGVHKQCLPSQESSGLKEEKIPILQDDPVHRLRATGTPRQWIPVRKHLLLRNLSHLQLKK